MSVRVRFGWPRRRVTVVLPRGYDEVWDARPAGTEPATGAPDPEAERRDRIRHRVTVFVVSVVFVAGVIALLFGERGYLDVRRSGAELDALSRDVQLKLGTVTALKEEVRRLRDEPAALERIAREELGFGRKGEVQFLLPRADDPLAPGTHGEAERPLP